jgi:hypothetical protein
MNDTEKFLHLLYGDMPGGWLEVTYINPETGKLAFDWATFPLDIQDTSFERLHGWNDRGYGVYVGMAARNERKEHGRGKQADATYISHLWCDIDDCDPIEGADRLCDFPICPSLIVSSGGGVHGYWLLDSPLAVTEETFQPIRRALHGLAVLCGKGGDPVVRDLARVMRVPGFLNTKRGVMCYLMDAYDVRWEWSRLHARFARHAPQEPPKVTRSIPDSARDKRMPPWITAWLNETTPAGQRNKTLYTHCRTLLDNGFSQGEVEGLVWPKAQRDGLQDFEIERTIASAVKAPRGGGSDPLYARMAWADSRLKGAQ